MTTLLSRCSSPPTCCVKPAVKGTCPTSPCPASACTIWPEPIITARAWTTEAPDRETSAAIASAVEIGATCVEMEAAALYALAEARGYDIVCLAHITNTMAVTENDFEKGEANGVHAALALTAHIARTLIAIRRLRR